jgi:hypothetical protein
VSTINQPQLLARDHLPLVHDGLLLDIRVSVAQIHFGVLGQVRLGPLYEMAVRALALGVNPLFCIYSSLVRT